MLFLICIVFYTVAHISILFYSIRFRHPKRRKRHRQKNYLDEVVTRLHLDEFKGFFRLSRSSVEKLLQQISMACAEESIPGITDSQGGGPQKSLEERLLAMLWFVTLFIYFLSLLSVLSYFIFVIFFIFVSEVSFSILDNVIVRPGRSDYFYFPCVVQDISRQIIYKTLKNIFIKFINFVLS